MLILNGVVAGYGGTTVLRGVSLSVPDRAVVAVLGAKGADRTTLLRAASGLAGWSTSALGSDAWYLGSNDVEAAVASTPV